MAKTEKLSKDRGKGRKTGRRRKKRWRGGMKDRREDQ